MEESEDNMSAEELKFVDGPVKNRPKKRSLVERELETSLTARVTSPLTNGDRTNTSRYGRARRLKSDAESCDTDKNTPKTHKSPKLDLSPSKVQSPAYKMHASNSPIRIETPKKDTSLENQIENIYNENVSLSRFSSEEKASKSSTKKFPKVYIRKDLIQGKDKEDDTVVLIKNMFSSSSSATKSNTHLENYLERSSEKYNGKKPINGYVNTSSVVKTLDFDVKKKKKDEKKVVLSKNELFELEAQCEYQVGDLVWARMGTYPFWPCIITKDPLSGTFVKKKLFGRFQRDVLHVTFFGDNGRRGWIVGTMLRKFLGQLEFEMARKNYTPETKKKDPRLYAAFFISDKKMPQWQISVDEAEMLLREPKRLRIDILYDMLYKGRELKTTPIHEKSKKIVRTNSDVSLSESLLDTLFAEDDSKGKDVEGSQNKSRNKSLDVSDVVTACLDNMAAKTGITKIQRQSHMDRWLQKAKSKTPEKSHLQSHLSLKMERDSKVSNCVKLKKKLPKNSPSNRPYNFRKNNNESQYETEHILFSHHNEHDYSLKDRDSNGPVILDKIEIEYENAEMFTSDIIEPGSGLGIISKVETLCDSEQADYENKEFMTDSRYKLTINDANNVENTTNQNEVNVQSKCKELLDLKIDLVVESDIPSLCTNMADITETNNVVETIVIKSPETIELTNTDNDENDLNTLPYDNTSRNSNFMSFEDQNSKLSSPNVLNCTSEENRSLNLCDSYIEPMKESEICDSTPITTKQVPLVELENQTAQVEKSAIEQDNYFTSCDKSSKESYDSLSFDHTSNSFDGNLLLQTVQVKESIVKVDLPENKELELNNSEEKNTHQDFLTKSEATTEIEESVRKLDNYFNNCDNLSKIVQDSLTPDVTSISYDESLLHQTTTVKENIVKVNLSVNKELELKDSIEYEIKQESLIVTETATQLEVSVKEQENYFTVCDTHSQKSHDSLTLDVTSSSFDENLLHQTTIVKESIVKENLSVNKKLQTNDGINSKTKQDTLIDSKTSGMAEVEETVTEHDNCKSNCDKPSKESYDSLTDVTSSSFNGNLSDQIIAVKKSIVQKEIFENKELKLNSSVEKQQDTFLIESENTIQDEDRIQHDDCFNDCDMPSQNNVGLKDADDDDNGIGIENFLDRSTNNLDTNTLENKSDLMESTDMALTERNLGLSAVLQVKEYVHNGIENVTNISEIQNIGEKSISSYSNQNENNLKKKNIFRDELTSLRTKNSSESNLANSKECGNNDINDSSDKCTDVGGKKNVMTSRSHRRININHQCKAKDRQNDLKEFEIQLYNIFGLSNEKCPKSKFNLALNKQSKNTNLSDKIKTKIDTVQINSNGTSECADHSKQKNENESINIDNTKTSSPICVKEVDLVKSKKQCSQKVQYETTNTNISNNNNNNSLVNELPKVKSDTLSNVVNAETTSTDVIEELRLKNNNKNLINIISDAEKKIVGGKVSDTLINCDSNDRLQNTSIDLGDNNHSPHKTNVTTDCQVSCDTRKALENPAFLNYFELNQDLLMEEQPGLTQEELTNHLYKTWLYQENLKTDKTNNKTATAILVNGLEKSPIKIKLSLDKTSKKHKKSYMVEITNDNEICLNTPDNIFVVKEETDLNKINLNDHVDETKSSLKRSKRIKHRHLINFEKPLGINVEDSVGNKVCEVTPEIKENNTSRNKNKMITDKEDKMCTDFVTISNKPSVQNVYKTDQTKLESHSYEKTDCIKNLSPKVNDGHIGKITLKRPALLDFKADLNSVSDDEKPLVAHPLRLTFSKNQSAYVADGETNTKDEIKDEKHETEKDDTDTSIQSADSENSFKSKKVHAYELVSNTGEAISEFNKLNNKYTSKAFNNPDFLKYLQLERDTLIDEHPELTEEEITNHLYNTWSYKDNLTSAIKKADDVEKVTNFIKGLNQDPSPVKKVRKKKIEKDELVEFNIKSEDKTRKEKSKRKTIKQYFYKEHFSDIEDDIEFFEIRNETFSTPTPVEKTEGQSTHIESADAELEYVTDETNKVEEYFRQLTAPKPNVFKGLLREKVCEICEKVDNLIKCKSCHCMFHVDCVKKKTCEVIEIASTVRGRKKKKKHRGRKAKDTIDSESQSDEKSQDLNASDEMLNTSLENEIEPYIVVNADDFEAQLCTKMKELLEKQTNENEFYSSAEEQDFDDLDYGECKIVDVLPHKKNKDEIDYSNFKCDNCQKYETPVCFVCKSAVSPKDKADHRQRCQVAHCQKYYHLECLNHWPQTQFNAGELSRQSNSKQLVEALTCPRHVCHTCVCDDPRGCKTRFSGDKLARCVRCPATYHTFTKCLPAGSQILTASHIICPRHYEHRPGTQPRHVNTGWCFICALGGTLICCEYCPTSFHAECLNIDPPEGGYMCEDCETGRLPLYGEMVWVKLGHYRWWPGIILHPCEIPWNILSVKHSQGEFVVRFFGQYDYYWVNRGRVFPFQEGDSGRISSQKSKIDAAFTMAMEHAQRACEVLKTASPNVEESMDIASSLLPPHYVKLKVNKPCGSLCGKKIDIEESSLTQCECDPNEVDPCGPYTQCLNRMLLTECGPTCRAGDRCNNRAFEKRLYPNMTPYRTPHRGWGLKALEDIKAGQFVIEYVGELIDEQEFRRRMRRKQEVRDENFYYLTLDKERMIDAGPKGNLARFMNHSCEPNCETQKWTVLGDVRVGLFALYDIPANSELTFNYNLESTGIEKKQCMCGAKRCSGYIGEKPKQDEQPKKNKQTGIPTKRTYKKRKIVELSPTTKPKQRVARTYKPRELTEIEKDLLIIKNATNGVSSDSESSRLSIDSKDSKGFKRRRTDDTLSPSTKKFKVDRIVDSTHDES
ncbi:putative histone-lysine N-methyltransferase 1 [Bicyclus anynana]|uniref:Histone-lysine N-methyltransferase 1 n=2 Tax=Satyrini TaxID=127320 RepID=A0A6J1P3R0_BICAN|nr:putative histone-lysine N-methyltransferase 1 [Bicyclus anynana]XP_052744883.1 putative histone-lysine N-methyltransferase 1 [Bicyclus anynana]XP_052744884.1 putative histone-lysine N-methyltransferase 1 [Bicyclus anynana]XP_052744885.1 putative histone-lysine N-methyltransferase 1 [Bicyclus anynana]XP_052744886.1 putative histone-lysine N-methyltransferase 1 [Bicyclus anynana]XP_052744887.1 putative histone-lysine N-methyltransferase 1 [Bicyclus anynana]XP_052744888.1 putative histone-lys